MFKIVMSTLMLLAFQSSLQAGTEPTLENTTKLYVATFNRAPDADGLNYWANDAGLDLEGIAQSFFDQPETKEAYPADSNNVDFVEAVYLNLFNRAPEAAGFDYWVVELDSGRIAKSTFILAVINGAQNYDATILTNKTTVGLAYVESGQYNDEDARDIMSGITDDYATVIAALDEINSYTEIQGGILNTDTTLTIGNSPYRLVGNLQINRNVTLTVDPGVKIVNTYESFEGFEFEVFGTIKINGTVDEKVVLDGVNIYLGDNNHDETARIEINYADMTGGSIYAPTGNSVYGMLILRNSTVTNLKNYMYIWYPTADCYIENNIFDNISQISVGISGGVKVYIRNNVFVKNSKIENWANYNNIDDMVVQYNSFLATDEIVVSIKYDSGRMNAKDNFWNTMDVEIINSMIFDQNDDLSLSGSIEYTPFLSEPHYDTPAYP